MAEPTNTLARAAAVPPQTHRPLVGGRPIIPNWLNRTDPSGQSRPEETQRAAEGSQPHETQATVAGENSIIPIVYGGPERIAGMIYTVGLHPVFTHLVVSYIVCEGEVDSITELEVNNEPLSPMIGATIYKGTQTQLTDPLLQASVSGFDEPMIGTAYVVLIVPYGVITGFPRLTCLVNGRKVVDPTIGGPAAWTNNPALITDDFMRTFAGRLVNGPATTIARNFCNAMIGPAPGEKRCTLTLTLADSRTVDEWIETLRGYVPGWVIQNAGEWHIIADAPAAVAHTFDFSNVENDPPPRIVKRGNRDVPNSVEISYTDTTAKPWATKTATAANIASGAAERKARISLPGIRRYSQAYRFAVERLNHYTLENIEGELATVDYGIKVLPSDLAQVNEPGFGWVNRAVRVLQVTERDNGRYGVQFRSYEPAAYSEVIATAPPVGGTTLPNPFVVAAVTGLAAVEALKFEKVLDVLDGIARGLIWQSRVTAAWDASKDLFFDYFEVKLEGSSLAHPMINTVRVPEFCSSTLIQGVNYTLSVRTINSLGIAGAWASVPISVLGKVTPPADVSVIDFAAEVGGEVIIRWRAVPDVDVVRYEWRGLATTATAAAWDAMTLVDRPDTTYIRIKGLAPGATLFAVKAIDSVGRYSANPLFINLLITSDASAFLQTFDFAPQPHATLTQENDVRIIEGDTSRPMPRWITKGQDVWNVAMPNPVASLGAPVVAGFGQNLAGAIYPCTTWDFGAVMEANVSLNLTWFRALRGTWNVYLAYSLDGTTWNYALVGAHVAGAATLGTKAVSVTARFIRPQFHATAATDTWMLEGYINAQVASHSRKETGIGTSSASTYARITLAQKYSKAVSISVTPKGTTPCSATFDNVIVGLGVLNTFDVYLFNGAVQIGPRDFAWVFEGV